MPGLGTTGRALACATHWARVWVRTWWNRWRLLPFQVERQVDDGDQVIFKLPRTLADDPADEGVVGHPRRQGLFPRNQGPASTRPDSLQLDAQLSGEQAAQRLAQRRALGVPGVVSMPPLPQGLLAGRAPVAGRLARADSRIQQRQLPMPVEVAGIDQGRQAAKPPAVESALLVPATAAPKPPAA